MSTALEQRLAPYDVTAKQWALLVALENGDASSPSELAKLLDVDVSAVTRLVARLEEKNLLRRRAHATDGRAQRLILTRQGATMTRKLRPVATGVLKGFHSGLSAREVGELHALLERLIANIPAD